MPVKSFVVFCFDVEIGGQMNAATSFNDKDDIQASFEGHCVWLCDYII